MILKPIILGLRSTENDNDSDNKKELSRRVIKINTLGINITYILERMDRSPASWRSVDDENKCRHIQVSSILVQECKEKKKGSLSNSHAGTHAPGKARSSSMNHLNRFIKYDENYGSDSRGGILGVCEVWFHLRLVAEKKQLPSIFLCWEIRFNLTIWMVCTGRSRRYYYEMHFNSNQSLLGVVLFSSLLQLNVMRNITLVAALWGETKCS